MKNEGNTKTHVSSQMNVNSLRTAMAVGDRRTAVRGGVYSSIASITRTPVLHFLRIRPMCRVAQLLMAFNVVSTARFHILAVPVGNHFAIWPSIPDLADVAC